MRVVNIIHNKNIESQEENRSSSPKQESYYPDIWNIRNLFFSIFP